jgi:hypothetical protein
MLLMLILTRFLDVDIICFAWQAEPPVVAFLNYYLNPCALSLSASILFQSGLL